MLPLCDRDHYFLARAAKTRCRLLNRKRDERPPLHRVKELRRQSRARVKQPAFPVRARIVPDHYSLGLLFKDVARTCLGIMLARARATQSDASTDRRGFYALEMILTPFCAVVEE